MGITPFFNYLLSYHGLRKLNDIGTERINNMTDVGTSNEKTRVDWIEKTLRQIPAGSRILDAGAGEQQFKKYCSHLVYVSQDFAKYDGKGDNRGLQMGSWDQSKLDIISDITSIPEPDGSFDAVICIEVFEHLSDPLLAIKEFSRLIKRGGHLVITAPFCSLTHFAPYHFSSGFNSYYYQEHLPKSGFEIIEITPNGNYFEFIAQEIRRVPSTAEKYDNDHLTWVERKATNIILNMLDRFSRKDKNSHEILCFGYHILAKRV